MGTKKIQQRTFIHRKNINEILLMFLCAITLNTYAQTGYELYGTFQGLSVTSPSQASNVVNPTIQTTGNGLLPPDSYGITATDGNDIRVLPSGHMQSEVHISIDPTNLNNVIASSNTYPSDYQQGYYVTNNAGSSWFGSEKFPGETYIVNGDPSTTFDAFGNAYIATIAPTGEEYETVKSTDKGINWLPPVRSGDIFEFWGGFDKEMIAADNTYSSPYAGNVYCAWTYFGEQEWNVKFNRSIDEGTTFSYPISLKTDKWGQGTNVQTGPNGEVYVCWADYPGTRPASGLGFAKSIDGGANFSPATIAFSYIGIRPNTPYSISADFNNTGINDFPSMAVDKSCGLYTGRIYVAYAANDGTGKAVIQVRYSDDDGDNWSTPNTINISIGRQNWFPWIAVDNSTGIVCVVYYSFDCNCPSTSARYWETNTYLAYSSDGGTTFTNIKVSDVPHITAEIDPFKFRPGYAGDYIGVTALGGKAYVAWADDRNGTWQIYVSPVTFSINYTDIEVSIVNNTTWSGVTKKIAGTLTVNSPATLTINTAATIEFGPCGEIVVNPGGKLKLEGEAKLTSLPTSVCDTCMWRGIEVKGNTSLPHTINNQGYLSVNNATIENAHRAVWVRAKGIVQTLHNTTSYSNKFINNNISIEFEPLSLNLSNLSRINNALFECNASLKNSAKYGGRGSSVFIKITGVKNVLINKTTFQHSAAFSVLNRGTGLKANNANYSVTNCIFRRLTDGVNGLTTGPQYSTAVNIKNNTFDDVFRSVTMNGGRYDVIAQNTFTNFPSGTYAVPYAINLYFSRGFLVTENNFVSSVSVPSGVVVSNAGSIGAEVYKNTFTGMNFGVAVWRDQSALDNYGLQIGCNTFAGYYNAIVLAAGRLADQGACTNGNKKYQTPAGNEFNGGCPAEFSHINVYNDAFPFEYRHHMPDASYPNVKPTCYNPKVTLAECEVNKISSSCPSHIPCNPPCLNFKRREIELLSVQIELLEKSPGNEEEIGNLRMQREQLVSDLIREYLENGMEENLFSFLRSEKTVEAKCLLAEMLIGRNNAEARKLLSEIPQDNEEHINFVKLCGMLLDLDNQGKTLWDMTAEQERLVRDVAATATMVSFSATAILNLVFGEEFINLPVFMLGGDNGRRMAPELNETTNYRAAELMQNIPNPFGNFTTIGYYVPDNSINAVINIFDVTGRRVKTYNLQKGDAEVKIQSSELPSGMYIYNMLVDGRLIGNKKMILMK